MSGAIFAILAAAAGQPAAAKPFLPSVASCGAHAPEAAVRSSVPVEVLLRVMHAESAGMPSVVSTKGAMGCMQIMPQTWRYLSHHYGLGSDPYDARMNMIGGAMYLAELARRFGLPGAFAAYNAGPARYIRYVASGAPLPSETVTYTARLGVNQSRSSALTAPARWQEAQLFLRENATVRLTRAQEVASHETTIAGPTLPAWSTYASSDGQGVQTLFPLGQNARRATR